MLEEIKIIINNILINDSRLKIKSINKKMSLREEMSLFYIDQIEDKKISWDQLLNDVKKKKSLDTNIRTNDYYQVLQNIFISLLEDIQITLFDPDDNNLSFQKKEKIKLKKINYPFSKTDFINRISSNKNWSINIIFNP